MTTVHLVKIKLDGDLRIMEVSAPPRFDALVKATMEAYALHQPAELVYTYQDSDGDQVRLTAPSSCQNYSRLAWRLLR